MTTCELEFLTGIVEDHGQMLDDETVLLMLEYFWKVHQTRPYLTYALKLSHHIGELVADHKETSVEITQYIEENLIPETLATYISMKRKDVEIMG